MNNQWLPGTTAQQWSMPPPVAANQPNQGWGEWQSLPPASSVTHQQLPSGQAGGFANQQLPSGQAGGVTHQQLPSGQAGGVHTNQQYRPQQPMSQKAYIDEQVARAREEQRHRELELQKQRMRSINVAQAKPLSSIDSLIGLEGMSPSIRKRAATQHRPPPTTISAPQPSLNKPRAWTMDTSNFEGVFSVPQEMGDDSFGEFQAPLPPLSGVGLGGGVVLTSSYTRPIASVKRSSPVIGQRNRSTSSPQMPRLQPQTISSSTNGVDQSAFPPLYAEVYNMCLVDGGLSTELLFPVLMSSHLPKSLLGHLWQQANKGVPGKLSQTELFVLLGLIGLVQAGHPNPRFADLKKAPAPPVPVLDKMGKAQPITTTSGDNFSNFQQGPSVLPINNTPLLPVSSLVPVSLPLPVSSSLSVSSLLPVSRYSASVSSSVLSFGASTLPPLVNTSLIDSTQRNEKYSPLPMTAKVPAATDSEFGEFKTATTDKFAAFDALKSTTEVSSDKILDFGEFSVLGSLQPVAAPATLTTTNAAILSDFTASQPSTGNNFVAPNANKEQIADLGLFASVSVSTTVFNSSSSDTMGWADFTSVPPPLPLSTATLFPLDTGPSPRQLFTTMATVSSAPQASSSVGFDSSAVLLNTVVESKPPPETKLKKPLTGLDILDAEMEARLLAKERSVVPSVDKPLVPESLDDFGDFETFGGSSQVKSVASQESDNDCNKPPPDSCEVWRKCLYKCVEVLEVCVGVFGGVDEETELKEEIAQSEEGRNKLKGVVEVYRLARRVYASLRHKDQGAVTADYTRAIRTHWSSLTTQLPGNVMEKLYSTTTPTNEVVPVVSDVLSDTISKCSLCLASKTVTISVGNSLDGGAENYPLPLLFHQGQTYHASCANFWINVVQEELPVLA